MPSKYRRGGAAVILQVDCLVASLQSAGEWEIAMQSWDVGAAHTSYIYSQNSRPPSNP